MYSSQFSQGEGQQDEWANFQQAQQSLCISSDIDLAMQYDHIIKSTLPFISLKEISLEVLKHHRITITHNTNLSQIFNVYEKDCYITIKKRHHYGTHCIYDVVLANFTLEIHLLNLHRSSDDNDAASSQDQIGKGGFGSVRVVKAGHNTLAVKRINFLKKAYGINGFDFQTQNAECKQIHKAIRQYCLYKICSMLKIGPQVIFNSNYDLVCFNNCIQFIMELCDIPSQNMNFMKERGLTIHKMKQDLFQNLALLHNLNIVHRDIKPDNILYSESLQRFVFGDFGITHSVSEQRHEKTLTNFAGTFDYCTQQMRQLFDNGKGHVNLYINDYYGLKKSLAECQLQVQKSQQLSCNAMSFKNQSINNMPYGQNESQNSIKSGYFQQWFQSQSSENITPNSTSNIYLSSTQYLNAPIKYASEINFFQSLILYQIFSTYQQKIKELSPVTINKIIEKYLDDMSCHFVEQQIKRYVLTIFYPSQSCSNLTLKIVDLKNTARNFGPKNEQTLQKIDQILSQLSKSDHQQVYEYFKSLKQSIQTNPQSFDISKFSKQMMIHLYLKNYNYFIGCCIRIMRENVRLINRLKLANKNQEIDKINRAFVCKIYIFCQKSNVLTIHQNNIINELLIKHWNEQQVIELQIQIDQIESQLRTNNVYNTKDYKYTQDPSNNRVVAKLTKFAVQYLMKSDQITNFQILQAFNVFTYRFNWTNASDYNFYHQFINKLQTIQNEDLQQNKKISLQVEIVKVYRKICRLQNHKEIDKTQYMKKVKVITYNLKRLSDKKFYFTCATQLIWMYYQSPEFNHMVNQIALKTLKQLQQYDCPQIQKYHCLIHINNVLGCLFLQGSSFDQALEHLRIAGNFIVSVYGSQNLMLSYFQILENIALIQYRQKDLPNALASYQAVLDYVQRTKKILCYEKSFIYRSIITIRLQMGVNKQQFPEIQFLIKNIVYETIFTLVSLTTSEYQLKHYILDLSIFSFVNTPTDLSVKIFVMKSLLKYIEDHLNYFRIPYDKLNYQLNKIYTNDLRQPSKGLAYIWNYLKIKLQDFKNVTIEDYRLLNDFALRLIKSNSSIRAFVLLKKYIYHIPLDMFKEREKAFRLIHKVHYILGHPFERITYQLTNKDCQALYNRDFSKIYREQSNREARMMNILLKKWLKRI